MRVSREPAREVEREPAPAAAPREAAADRVLALQRTAGNRAVAALLAREPDAPTPTDSKGPPPKQAEGPSGMRATLSGLGTIAVLSVGVQSSAPAGGPGGRGRGGDRPVVKEIAFTSTIGKHSAAVQQALIDGKAMDGEIVLSGGLTIIVKGAVVASYSTLGTGDDKEPLESWSINPTSIEYVAPQKDGKDGKNGDRTPDQDGWDLGEGA